MKSLAALLSLAAFTVAGQSWAQSQTLDKQSPARSSMAPHSLMVQAELQSALEHIKAARSQLKDVPVNNVDSMNHYKLHGKEIDDDLKIAVTHCQELTGAGSQFPDIAQSPELKAVEPAVGEVQIENRKWQQKATKPSYWNNKNLATRDLNDFEQKLAIALDKIKSLDTKVGIDSEVG